MSFSLDEQRIHYAQRRGLAMPLAGMIAWTITGLCGVFLSPIGAVWGLFLATGSILYLGLFLSRFTGENFMDKSRPKNAFDRLFLLTVGMSVLVYAIAIPFFQQDYTSLPLTVGILSGLMWVPLSWLMQHWVGLFHGIGRTLLVVAAWYGFPGQRFIVIPAIIVGIYAVTIIILERRWRQQQGLLTAARG